MKHVFVIHSHTPMLTSMGVIHYLHLKTEDVVFLSGRNYQTDYIPNQYKIYSISDEYTFSQEVYYQSYSEQNKIVEAADRIINNYINEDFILYIPNFCVPLFVAIYTNKLCKEARYIQEGGYVQKNVFRTEYSYYRVLKDIIRDIKYMRPFRLWIPCSNYTKKHLYKQKELHSYALTKRHFRNLPSQQHVIKWPKIELDIKINSQYPIFITDGFVKNKMAEKECYYKQIIRLIAENHGEYNYIKFHPAQSKEERNDILDFFKKERVDCEVLPDNVPVEIIIVNNRNLKFVGMGSSLLYFAHDNKHQVVCHDDWMLENSKLYKQYYIETGAFLFKDYYKLDD